MDFVIREILRQMPVQLNFSLVGERQTNPKQQSSSRSRDEQTGQRPNPGLRNYQQVKTEQQTQDNRPNQQYRTNLWCMEDFLKRLNE